TLTYGYNDPTATHVTNVTDNFGLTSTATINLDFGVTATSTDANGKIITYNYDKYGRLAKVFGPTDGSSGTPTIQNCYGVAPDPAFLCPNQNGSAAAPVPWAMTRHKDFQSSSNDSIDTVTFIDALERVIETKKEAEVLQPNGTILPGFSVSGQTVFDTRGR